VQFEYDPAKSGENRQKHGIDFEQAQALWNGKVVTIASRYPEEKRLLAIGQIAERSWTAIITQRHENIRIISVRLSRAEEEALWQRG